MWKAFCSVALLLVPRVAWAHPVISEVMWMGSDSGTTDEWIEIANPDAEPADLSGWSLWLLRSGGQQSLAVRFATGTMLDGGEHLVIARRDAAGSRLAQEPAMLVPDMSLLNTNLLLTLRDPAGTVIDQADDGSGAPFAGANPSGTGAKASMERIDLFASGGSKDNWRTATESVGFDAGTSVRGSPGFPNPAFQVAPPSECSDPLAVAIVVQSGELKGTGKTTVNFQAAAVAGSLASDACRWDYGDGFTSASCNPPVHAFTIARTFTVRLDARNACGSLVSAVETVEVVPGPENPDGDWYDGSRLILRSALPNPEGSDTGREWIEILNPETRPVVLSGWRLRLGETSFRWYRIQGSVEGSASLRIYADEADFALPNSASRMCLVPPGSDDCLSALEWGQAEEGREYYSTDLRETKVTGRILRAIGSTVLEIQLDPASASALGSDRVFVKLIGISAVPSESVSFHQERMDILFALTEAKKVELEFDTEMWDALGRLLAYVYTDQQLPLQEQLLVTGFWMADRTSDFLRKERFLSSEKPEVVALMHGDTDILPAALTEEPEPVKTFAHNPLWDGIRISEIFPSPAPSVSDGIFSHEWLEIDLHSAEPLSLSGFVIQSGTKKKSLPSGLGSASGSLVIVSMTDLKLALKNGGSSVSLFSPDGILIDSVEYPFVKHGQAYALARDNDCITVRPTPLAVNDCSATAINPQKKPRVTPAVSPRVRGYVNHYLGQLDSGGDIVEIGSTESGFGLPVVLLAFGLGLGFGVLPALIFRRETH
jgi:PKD repeat protein